MPPSSPPSSPLIREEKDLHPDYSSYTKTRIGLQVVAQVDGMSFNPDPKKPIGGFRPPLPLLLSLNRETFPFSECFTSRNKFLFV